MCTRQECISLLTDASDYIKNEFGVKSLLIFGSMARGNNNVNSDVDICVDMPAKLFKIIEFKQYLKDLLGTEVDVVRKSQYLNECLTHEIERDGIRIFSE
jgi:predicted nucleotidyltransferase